jgi:hypothetical protein
VCVFVCVSMCVGLLCQNRGSTNSEMRARNAEAQLETQLLVAQLQRTNQVFYVGEELEEAPLVC